MVTRRALGLTLTLLGVDPRAALAGPACVAQVEVEPSHAVVGEQVLYTARLLRRPDVSQAAWTVAPGFPSFRAERLPGLMGQQRIREHESFYLVYEERRALFPTRAGQLEIPPAELDCQLHGVPGARGATVTVTVPGAVVDVAPVPADGRPADWSGVVGALSVASTIEPDRVALGGSVRVVVVLRGESNLWDARPPLLVGRGLEGTEVFARPERLDFEAGPRLRARRIFEFEVVPRRAGPLVIPPVVVTYFDPSSNRFGVASAAALTLTVEPGAAPPAAADAAGALAVTDGAAAAGGPAFGAAARGAASGLALLGGIVLWRRWRRARAADQAEQADRTGGAGVRAGLRASLARAEAAAARGDARDECSALALALRQALAAHLQAGAASATAEELAAHADARGEAAARAAAALLLELEQARFSGPAAHAPASRAVDVRRALARLAGGDAR